MLASCAAGNQAGNPIVAQIQSITPQSTTLIAPLDLGLESKHNKQTQVTAVFKQNVVELVSKLLNESEWSIVDQVVFSPLFSSCQRWFIHNTVQTLGFVMLETVSSGEDKDRFLTIYRRSARV